MLTRNRLGFISHELSLGLLFTSVFLFSCYKMLTHQNSSMLLVEQEVEATSFVYEMKEILKNQCTLNFKGLGLNEKGAEIRGIKELIEYDDGSVLEVKYFSKKDKEDRVLKGSTTGLSLLDYSLSPVSHAELYPEGETTLEAELTILFSRGIKGRTISKSIPIYLELNNGSISKCSLSTLKPKQHLWSDRQGLLHSKSAVGFGVEHLTASIGIHEKGLYVERGMAGCQEIDDRGTLYWETHKKKWVLCTGHGLEVLEDGREVVLW